MVLKNETTFNDRLDRDAKENKVSREGAREKSEEGEKIKRKRKKESEREE